MLDSGYGGLLDDSQQLFACSLELVMITAARYISLLVTRMEGSRTVY